MKRLRTIILTALAATSLLTLGAQVPVTAQEATPLPVAADLATFSTTLVGILSALRSQLRPMSSQSAPSSRLASLCHLRQALISGGHADHR